MKSFGFGGVLFDKCWIYFSFIFHRPSYFDSALWHSFCSKKCALRSSLICGIVKFISKNFREISYNLYFDFTKIGFEMWEILDFQWKHKDSIQHSFLTFLTIQCTIFQVQNTISNYCQKKKDGNLKEMNGFEVEMGVIFDTLNTTLSSTICHLIRDSSFRRKKNPSI